MIWTVIGYIVDSTRRTAFTKTFYGSHEGTTALQDAKRMFGDEIEIVAVVAGNHLSSTFVTE